MFYVSEVRTDQPTLFSSPLQEKVYSTLEVMGIPFKRVETDTAITMKDCEAINTRLEMNMVKTLFVCSRKKTDFYLYLTCGDKPFDAKAFSRALDIPRVSFASENSLKELTGVSTGAATIFSVLFDSDHRFRVVIDRDVAREEWLGCSDGTTSGFLKVPVHKVLGEILSLTGHEPLIIEA